MKIAFFDIEQKEIEFFKKELQGQEIYFFEESINETNLEKFSFIRDLDIISVFIYSKLNKKVIDFFENLKLITTRSTGIDHIDLEYAKSKNISVLNVPSYGENTVAEHTFALILALSRNIQKAYIRTINQNFDIQGLEGFDLNGKTLGVIGTGKIGIHVIKIAKGFGMDVIAYDKVENSLAKELLNFRYVELDYLLSNSDIVTIHIPLMPETYHLINLENIKKFKRGSLLINTARGAIVDTDAILYGLENKILAGVGLDVIEGEEYLREEKEIIKDPKKFKENLQLIKDHILIHHENVIFTPHIAFYSKEAEKRIMEKTKDNIKLFIKE
ncbi:MAG: NAD(P)-dependent oxidoreductase [Candidatus Woesearchaeota archaeon]